MQPAYRQMNITAMCPDCGSPTTFERTHRGNNQELGYTIIDGGHTYNGGTFSRILYRLFRCSVCGRGGIAKLHDGGNEAGGVLEAFYPTYVTPAKLPATVPADSGDVNQYSGGM